MTPTGALRPHPVESSGDTFTLSLPATESGRYEVSVSATGPFGPSPLLQLPLYVDTSPPTFIDVRTPDAEAAVHTEADAAARAHELVNHYRARHRKAALPRDPALDAIARGHARDMRDARFFGHRSPSTGDLSDRLSAARYRALYSSENLARAQTLGEATDGLYESLGHRRNLLSDAPTVVGLAAVLADPAAREKEPRSPARDWFLVQVFAKPSVTLDARREANTAHRAIAERRRVHAVPPLARSARLDALAARALADPRGPTDAVLQETNRAARAQGGAWIWMASLPEPAALELPSTLTQARWTHVGVAFSQDPADRHGLVRVALLLASMR